MSVFTYCMRVCTTVKRNLQRGLGDGGREGVCRGSTNMPAMHHFIINSHVGIKSPTLSDLTDG